MIQNLIRKINNLRSAKNPIETVLVTYEIHLSFNTHFQIWYRDDKNQPRVREIKGEYFQKIYKFPKADNKIELLAFVHNPTLRVGEQIVLTIKIEDKRIETLTFDLPADKSYSGWYKIAADLI